VLNKRKGPVNYLLFVLLGVFKSIQNQKLEPKIRYPTRKSGYPNRKIEKIRFEYPNR